MGWVLDFKGDQLKRVSHEGGGSPPRIARNMIYRNIEKQIMVAFFARENLGFTKARHVEFANSLEACVISQLKSP